MKELRDEKNYSFSNKLIQLRKEKGLSQEQLADYLSVSRQAVSKWEASLAMPALEKIILLSDLFGVSVDYLVRDNAAFEDKNKTVVTTLDDTVVMEQLSEIKSMMGHRNVFEYRSKTTVCGIPLVHIKFTNGLRPSAAKGIIAIGNIAVGVISIGAIAVGVLSLGAIAAGLFLAAGAIAMGGFSFGGLAFGIFAAGGVAVGINAFGGVVLAKELAVGGVASGNVAIGSVTEGNYVIDTATASAAQIREICQQHYPNMPEFVLKILSSIAKK